MTKQQKTALNMAKFIQNQSLLLLEKLNELDLDVEADLCEKLHDDAEHLSVHCPRDWMHYRMVTDGQSVY
ncbi:Rop family plasmid primer RNA-binding protein [Klebsiella pneumoniae]|uniref:Rop family plasmid primer RNA-binding protein n=1 Tax=Klebsiella pneumoniae TaxID=573 RepID=UPI003F6E235E